MFPLFTTSLPLWHQWQREHPLIILLPLKACSPCHQLSLPFQLFFMFALMVAISSFGNTASLITDATLADLYSVTRILLEPTTILKYDLIKYIYPFTLSSYHGSTVFKTVFDFSQDFHQFCFDQWCNIPTFFSIL